MSNHPHNHTYRLTRLPSGRWHWDHPLAADAHALYLSSGRSRSAVATFLNCTPSYVRQLAFYLDWDQSCNLGNHDSTVTDQSLA